ncbi:hypothetical protein A6V36_24280 [Paraburkholderia ginsengiterrae]|uniref:DUF4238 domain-containing protein n=1 Tax=Paraburkholderia ginsengiterrae TaxID=1462993 RepID=A0A1A9NA33_9BURK|nr:hypothetical protein [Paraburkholderia ginsengiterrae]OAJ61493.1 hypothetical protein A6V36_24280 [Paraburkholderia ginsengiterrae]OAJ62896.1 hypothetical protein A6V37_22060 [Paraburkholderia ginsengiterrae]
MDLTNETRNQHFLPQVEQRLNAHNPDAPASKQRIYAFKVIDREALTMQLESKRGRSIANNLSFLDLFTFDTSFDTSERMNFESLFRQYENQVASLTNSLLQKMETGQRDNTDEVVDLFAAKLLNFSRNPYSVTKVLNTFGVLADYRPTDPKKQRLFDRIVEGRKPQQAWLCAQLGLSDTDYVKWLKMLFMLFMEGTPSGESMLDMTARSIFERKGHHAAVLISRYSKPGCLLSDRSFSTNIDRPDANGFDFNLSSRAFIRYLFIETDGVVPPAAPRHLVEMYRQQTHDVQLMHFTDNEPLLKGFNRNVVYQCYSHVFCAIPEGIVL